MLDTVFGLPVHALVVHAVVVLLPLAALGAIAVTVVPRLMRGYGPLVAAATVAAVAAVPVATRSGQHLYDRKSASFTAADVAEAALMERHRQLGHQLLPWAVLLLAGVLVTVATNLLRTRMPWSVPAAAPAMAAARTGTGASRAEPDGRPPSAAPTWWRVLSLAGSVVTVVAAVITLVLVTRIGHAGSDAVWSRLSTRAG